MKPLNDTSAIYQMIVDPIEKWFWVWVCKHGIGYPDVCSECQTMTPELDRIWERWRTLVQANR